MKKCLLLMIFCLLSVYIHLAGADLLLSPRPLDSNGNLMPNTQFNYTYNLTLTSNCGGVLASNTTVVTTDSSGVAFIYLNTTKMTQIPSYLCEYRNGILRAAIPLSDSVINNLFGNSANFSNNVTASYFHGKLNYSDIDNLPLVINDNSSWNESHADSKYLQNTGNQVLNGNMNINGNLSVVGSYINLTVTNEFTNGSLIPLISNIFNLGSPTNVFANIYGYIDSSYVQNVPSAWTTTYNSTYNTWAYNQTIPAINTILGFNYYNSTNAPTYKNDTWAGNQSNYYNKTDVNTNISTAITSLSNSTIVRQGTYNCSANQVFQNATINSTGIYGQCVTASSGVLNYNNITMLNVSTQNMTFYNLNVSNNFNVNDTIQLNETLHVNLINYGTFTGSASGWNLGTGWRYNSNHVEKYVDGTGILSSTEGGCYAGNKYRITYTISSWTAGTYTATSCGVTLITRSVAGTYTEDIIATVSSAGQNFRVTPSNTARFNMDDVSLYQIQGTFRLGRTIFTQHENDQNIQSYNLPYSQGDGVLTNSAGQLGWSNTYTPTVWDAKGDASYSFGSNNFDGNGNFSTGGNIISSNLNVYPSSIGLNGGTEVLGANLIYNGIYNGKPSFTGTSYVSITWFLWWDGSQWVLSTALGSMGVYYVSPALLGTYLYMDYMTTCDAYLSAGGNTESVTYSSNGTQGISDCYDSALGGQVCSINGLVYSITDDPSDASLKANVKNLTLDLNKFSQINPSEWIWNMTTKSGSGYGLVAQDLEKVYPQLVKNGTMTIGKKKVNYKTIDYAGIITLLISKNQQLEQQINIQKDCTKVAMDFKSYKDCLLK